MSELTVKPIDTSAAAVSNAMAAQALERVKGSLIVDQTSFENAGTFLIEIKKRMKVSEDQRKSMTSPLDVVRKIIMDLFRPTVDCYQKATDIVMAKRIHYKREQDKIREEQERKLRVEAEKKRLEAQKKADEARAAGNDLKAEKYDNKAEAVSVAPILPPRVDDVKGISDRKNWYHEVIDESLVPDEWWIIDEKALASHARSRKEKANVPGVRFYFTEKEAVRTK